MANPMAKLRLGRSLKRAPLSFCAKVSLAIFLALAFVVIWTNFSPSSSNNISLERSIFDEIEAPPGTPVTKQTKNRSKPTPPPPPPPAAAAKPAKDNNLDETKTRSPSEEENKEKIGGGGEEFKEITVAKDEAAEKEEQQEQDEIQSEEKEENVADDVLEEVTDSEDTTKEDNVDDVDGLIADEDDANNEIKERKNKKKLGALFEPRAHYTWKLCSTKTSHNHIPCVDMEGGNRHHERSCPRTPFMCLVSLPQDYRPPLSWPERESKIWYKNVAHAKLSDFFQAQNWLNLTGDYLMFPKGESEFKGGANQYIESIEEMVPDIVWGKNIHVVLDVGCVSASFGATLLQKDVITLSLGQMSDRMNLAQVTLERGIPAVVGNLVSRRLHFPGGVFDAIHCSECNMPWHSNGGRLILEMNRILRPGGYFIISTKIGDADSEEGMSKLMESICWNILAHKVDEDSELSIKIYQKPASNDLYRLRRTKEPPFCKENENQDDAWYKPIKTCLHKLPAAIEERGTDWPEEWPKRLKAFPEWLGDAHEKLIADHEHWKAIIEKSYLNGLGIDWSDIRNVMDMKAIYGGFAAALASQKVWVMNVVPVHAPNTLPIIFERGLLGIYHDWCEPFSTYPRTYDLLHADHLFSRLKNRCKQPVVIVVEMDRILRPGGWAIIRDKLEILNPLETILRSLHWDIRMTYGKDKEGIICAQKATWRP